MPCVKTEILSNYPSCNANELAKMARASTQALWLQGMCNVEALEPLNYLYDGGVIRNQVYMSYLEFPMDLIDHKE